MPSIVIPYNFVALTTIASAQVDANFAAVIAVVNGNLNYTNLSSTAGILTSQLAGPFAILNNGRLYGTTVTPYGDTTSTSTIYFGPTFNGGNFITIENTSTSTLVMQTFSEVSLTLTGLTATVPYDVYVSSASSSTVSLSTSAWTNATTPPSRSTDIAGRYTQSGNAGALWVGAFYAITSSTTADSPGSRYIGNAYNKAQRSIGCNDTTASYTYNSSTVRAANGNTTNGTGRIGFLAVDYNPYTVVNFQNLGTASGNSAAIGIAQDSTTATTVQALNESSTASASLMNATCTYANVPTIGAHYIQRTEFAPSGTSTWYGGANCGMYGSIWL